MPSPHKKSFAAEQLARRKKKNPVVWIFVCLIVIILVAGGYIVYQRSASHEQVRKETQQIKSIAVLPFRDMSPEKDQDYLCEGIADAIIDALANVKNLQVPATTSSFLVREKGYDIQEIGEKLHVQSVLEGSLQKSGNTLRVRVQLIDVSNGYHVWSDTIEYSIDDIFSLQDEISHTIVEKLNVSANATEKEAIKKRYTENTEAYSLFLQGRFLWSKRSENELKQAIQFFQEAIELDPSYALAYVGIADSYNSLGFWGFMYPREAYSKVKDNAEKALNIDNMLAEAHVSLAGYYLYHDYDWDSAESEFKKALVLKPEYSTAHHWYSDYLTITGRHEESLAEALHALKIDPFSPIVNYVVADRLLFLHEYDKSMEQSLKTISLFPDFGYTYWNIGSIYLDQNNYKEAIPYFEKAIELSGDFAMANAWLGYTYGKIGEKGKALALIEKLTKRTNQRYVSPLEIGTIFLGLGDKDSFFEWAEKAYEERDTFIPYFNAVFRDKDNLYDDPRFKSILTKLNLSEN